MKAPKVKLPRWRPPTREQQVARSLKKLDAIFGSVVTDPAEALRRYRRVRPELRKLLGLAHDFQRTVNALVDDLRFGGAK